MLAAPPKQSARVVSQNESLHKCYCFLNTAASKMSRFRQHTTLMCQILSQLIEIEKNINKHDSNCTLRFSLVIQYYLCFSAAMFDNSQLFPFMFWIIQIISFHRQFSKSFQDKSHSCILRHHVIFHQSEC